MNIKQFNDQLCKLQKEAGEKSTDALLQIMEFKMEDFKTYLDHKFDSIEKSQDKFEGQIKWIIAIGFTAITVMMGLLKFL